MRMTNALDPYFYSDIGYATNRLRYIAVTNYFIQYIQISTKEPWLAHSIWFILMT